MIDRHIDRYIIYNILCLVPYICHILKRMNNSINALISKRKKACGTLRLWKKKRKGENVIIVQLFWRWRKKTACYNTNKCVLFLKKKKGWHRLKLDKADSKVQPVMSVCYLPEPLPLLFTFLSVSVITSDYALYLFGFIRCFSIFVEKQGTFTHGYEWTDHFKLT